MTASAGPALKRLHEEFGDRVEFLTVYVREAHPGEKCPQPRTAAEKMEHARAYQERDGIPWTVAVDDVGGEFHRALDAKPNAAFLVGADGEVVFRSLWSNDALVLREALAAAAAGRPLPAGERQTRVVPMLKGMGTMAEVLDSAGEEAKEDVRREAPPVYALAQLAGSFQPLSPLGRGVAATAIAGLGLAAAVAGAAWAIDRARWLALYGGDDGA